MAANLVGPTYSLWQLPIAWSIGLYMCPIQIRLDPLQHGRQFYDCSINVDHPSESMATLGTVWIHGGIPSIIDLNHLFERDPDISRGSDKVFSPFDQCPSIDHILRKEVDEFEEFVVCDFIINVLLDLVEEGDFFRRCEGLRGSGTGSEEGKIDIIDGRGICLALLLYVSAIVPRSKIIC